MKYRIFITVDENDADYQFSDYTISEEMVSKIKELLEKVKEFRPYKSKSEGLFFEHSHNFPVGEQHREDLGEKSCYELYGEEMRENIDLLLELCPYCEYGFHSIVSVEIVPEKDIVVLY